MILDLGDDDLRWELRRIGAELRAFPYVPVDVQRQRRSQYMVTGSAGALVYHDIIAEGGAGTRVEVRVVVDRVIVEIALAPSQVSTGRAAIAVARLRSRKPKAVSTPLLPEDAGHSYHPDDIGDEAELAKARHIGKWLAPALRRHAKTPCGPRGVETRIKWARAAWRAALNGTGDDTLLWLDEMESLKQMSTALRMFRRHVDVAQKNTRLITLEDLDDENFA